jgi:hypothetical protein
MDHLVALDIFLYEKGYHWENNEYASYGNYQFTVLRNHAGGSSGVSGCFKLWVDPNGPYKVGDTDDVPQVIEYGQKTEVIKKVSAGYSFVTPYVDSGEVCVKTLKDLEKFFLESPTIYLDIRQQVLAKVMDIRTKKRGDKESRTSAVAKGKVAASAKNAPDVVGEEESGEADGE